MKAAPTWTTTHVFGECLVNHHKKLMFIKIPKCASSWCDDYLARLGSTGLPNSWHGANFQDPSLVDYRPLVVLRDPIDRWISVTPADKKIMSMQSEDEIVGGLLEMLETYLQDEHLAPQQDFISGLDHSRATYFQFGPDLGWNFTRFIIKQGLGEVDIGPFVNQGSDAITKEKWRTLMQREDFTREMKRIYQRDYALIDSVKFWSYPRET